MSGGASILAGPPSVAEVFSGPLGQGGQAGNDVGVLVQDVAGLADVGGQVVQGWLLADRLPAAEGLLVLQGQVELV